MNVPQRLTMVTLGVADVARSTEFYESLGWRRSSSSEDTIAFFKMQGSALGLYEREALAEDATVDPAGSGFRGVTCALNCADPAEVDAVFAEWVAVGATPVKEPQDEEALANAVGLAPGNPHPRTYRGLALLELGRPREARDELETALAAAPDDPTARTGLARLELAEGRPEAAEALARGALARHPGELEVRLVLARALLELGDAAAAVAAAEAAVAVAPERSDALYLLARALLESGRRDEGRRALERFRALKAREEEIRLRRAPKR